MSLYAVLFLARECASASHVVITFYNVTNAELIGNETRRVKHSDWLIRKLSSNGTNIQTIIRVGLFVAGGYESSVV